ncbi:MAG: deoxynucleoside kinase [Bacteroidales bacterium]|nr:thymidylate kinase [Bacteroidales bacterium]MBR4088720.1 deoxynucleoside kinase [Bacteroidales bacterium]
MLIVLEGLDGAGKSTQVKLLKEYLISKGVNLRYLHFPRYGSQPYGELIGKYLRGDFGSIDQVHPQIVALLFALDRMDAASTIKEWLEAGDCVLLDRYVYSNIAYQCSKIMMQPQFEENRTALAQELRNWIFDTEYNRYGIPKPDLNLFLNVPIEFVDSKLKESRNGDDDRDYLNGKADIHEADIRFQISVREIYLQQTESDPDFVKVCCEDAQGKMLPPDKIFGNIKEQVDKLF